MQVIRTRQIVQRALEAAWCCSQHLRAGGHDRKGIKRKAERMISSTLWQAVARMRGRAAWALHGA